MGEPDGEGFMKDYLVLMADYNAAVNQEMCEIVGGLPDETRRREAGSDYGSIFGLLNHIYDADSVWLLRIRNNFPGIKALKNEALEGRDISYSHEPFPDFETLRLERRALDGVFVGLMDELAENDLVKPLEYTNMAGLFKRFPLGEILAHVFNHQTHHHGARSPRSSTR